jgi:hypothetical protein
MGQREPLMLSDVLVMLEQLFPEANVYGFDSSDYISGYTNPENLEAERETPVLSIALEVENGTPYIAIAIPKTDENDGFIDVYPY